MLIRSQDKKKIVNLNNVDEIAVVSTKIYAFNGRNHVELGLYSTEEKTIKVLDMIQEAYNSIETMKIDKCAWRDNHYFQMPQDDEVEV